MKQIKGKSIIQSSKLLAAACVDLRHEVEHQGSRSPIILLGSTYKHIDPNAIKTVTVDGVKIGYRIRHLFKGYHMREVFVKVKGYKVTELPTKDREAILGAVMDAFIQEQGETPEVAVIADDCLKYSQTFDVVYQYERNPDLRSIAGGLNLDKDGKIVT
jgi:hypothetical protein